MAAVATGGGAQNLSYLRGLDKRLRVPAERALRIANAMGIPVTVTSGFRSMQHQAKLRAEYEAGQKNGRPTKWPANRPGDSGHNYGLAFDSWTPDEYMPWWIMIRQGVGLRVPPNDVIHAEIPNWRSLVRLKR